MVFGKFIGLFCIVVAVCFLLVYLDEIPGLRCSDGLGVCRCTSADLKTSVRGCDRILSKSYNSVR